VLFRSHELRQPLNSMSVNAMLLASETGGGQPSKWVRKICDAVARMSRLVGDLTDVCLVDMSRIRLKRKPTDLVSLVERLADGADHDASRNVRVSVRGEVPSMMQLDPGRIEQIVSNLLTNAKKYGRTEADAQVTIERDGDKVLVSVTNDGTPIPAGKQARLFDRYYRAHDGRTDGLGIGLYVCRALAEAHGGTISVRSDESSTTFRVALPVPSQSPTVVSCRPLRAMVLVQ
jgi:signal transduction histidine kinase